MLHQALTTLIGSCARCPNAATTERCQLATAVEDCGRLVSCCRALLMLILLDKSSGAFHDNIFNWTVMPLIDTPPPPESMMA